MKKRFLLLSLLLAVCCLGPVLGQSSASAAADLAETYRPESLPMINPPTVVCDVRDG